MSNRLIISEKQLGSLADYVLENNHSKVVENVVEYLKTYYEPYSGVYKKGGEYHKEPMVKNMVNGELMTVKSLYEHMLYKFDGLATDFIKQVIDDWYKDKIGDDYKLSKNVKV